MANRFIAATSNHPVFYSEHLLRDNYGLRHVSIYNLGRCFGFDSLTPEERLDEFISHMDEFWVEVPEKSPYTGRAAMVQKNASCFRGYDLMACHARIMAFEDLGYQSPEGGTYYFLVKDIPALGVNHSFYPPWTPLMPDRDVPCSRN